MEIKISKDKKIITDSRQYIYCVKKIIKGKEVWKQRWFYSTLKVCYNSLLEELTREGEKKTLKENVEEALKLLESVKKAIK